MKCLGFYIAVFALLQSPKMTAQEAHKKTYLGIELLYQNPDIFKQVFFPSLTLGRDKHFVFGGPQMVFLGSVPKPLWGGQVGYRFFPNGSKNRFNLFFEFANSVVSGQSIEKPSYSTYYKIETMSTRLLSIDNYFGFGFQFNIAKGFYLSSGFAAGLGVYKADYKYTYKGGLSSEYSESLRLRSISKLNLLFKIGLAYKFDLSKK